MHRIRYVDLSMIFRIKLNRFYYENRIIPEQNSLRQSLWIKLIILTRGILITYLDLQGIEVPGRM